MPERPISLADVRQASRVYVRLPVDPYWREEGEELEDKASHIRGWLAIRICPIRFWPA